MGCFDAAAARSDGCEGPCCLCQGRYTIGLLLYTGVPWSPEILLLMLLEAQKAGLGPGKENSNFQRCDVVVVDGAAAVVADVAAAVAVQASVPRPG